MIKCCVAPHALTSTQRNASPVAVPVWRDLMPGNAFLLRLFYGSEASELAHRSLPDGLSHHLLFGYQRNGALPGASSDRIVPIASQLAPEAQREVRSVYGFDTDHAGILRDPAVIERVRKWLVTP